MRSVSYNFSLQKMNGNQITVGSRLQYLEQTVIWHDVLPAR